MTDEAERKVRQWAVRRNGYPLTANDAVELALAIDEDAVAREKRVEAEAIRRHNETVEMLEKHCAEALARDLRITALEDWRRHQAETCTDRVKAIAAEVVHEIHGAVHEQHIAEHHAVNGRDRNDPDDSAFLEHRESAFPEDEDWGDVKRAWKTLRWFVIVVVAAVIVMLADQLGNLLFGGPT